MAHSTSTPRAGRAKSSRRGPPESRTKNPPQPKPTDADLMAGVYRWILTVRATLDSIHRQAGRLRDATLDPKCPLAGMLNVTALHSIRDEAMQCDSNLVDLFANTISPTEVTFSDVFDLLSKSKGGKS